nr:solute carrier organic anion transporter family member 2A1-like [Halyomorpha halys]
MDKSCSDLKNGEENTNCGFEWYSPLWLQGLASKKIYVLVYGFLGMNQTAIGSYFIGTISTIEKRFKLPSSASGLIASAWDLGALCTVVTLAYFGAGGHKARWVSACGIIAAVSCYLRYLPYLLFGPQENLSFSSNSSVNLCNTSIEEKEYCSFNSEGFTTWLILIAANIGLGVGTSTYNTLGAAYLDDNSLKDKTPFLLSVVTCLRHIGGLLGFLLASYTLNQNEIPNVNKSFDERDQSWIGAWYLGWIPLGTVHLVFALMMAAFPKILPREAERRQRCSTLYQNGSRSSIAGLYIM